MLHFFDVIYYIKKTFSGVSEVEQLNQKALAIEQAADGSDEQNKMIANLVISVAGPSIKTLKDMTEYIHPGGNYAYKVVEFAIKRAWEAIADFTLDENKLEEYRLFLSYLKKTNGASMNSKNKMPEDLDKSDLMDDESLQRFVRTFNALKDNKMDHDLYSLVHFIYENELQNVMFRRMNRDLSQLHIAVGGVDVKDLDDRLQDGQKFTDVVPNETLILVPILEEMKELKRFNNELRKKFYLSILGVDDYKDDNEFLAKVKEANRQFIDLNIEKMKEIAGNTGQTDVLKKIISKRMEDAKAVKQDSKPDIAAKFNKADVRLTLENLMAEYVSFPDDSRIIDEKDIEDVQVLIDESIISMFNYAVKKLSDIERNVYDYNALLKERLRIDSGNNSAVMLPLKEIIERWQAFVQTPLFGQEIMDGLLKQIEKNDGGRFDSIKNFEFKALKPEVTENIIRVIENFKLSSDKREVSVGLREITGEKNMSADRELSVKVEVLKLLKEFFLIPFDIKKTLQMIKAFNGDTFYDAACVLVYIKDNKIKESYDVGEVMLFEKRVLLEDRNWLGYFKRLSQKVMDFIAKRREVDKKADVFSYLRSEENKFESSRDDENKIAQEVVDDMEKLAKTSGTDEELNKMEDAVENVIKGSGQVIKFSPEDANGVETSREVKGSGQTIKFDSEEEKPEENSREKDDDEEKGVETSGEKEVPQTNTPSKPGSKQ